MLEGVQVTQADAPSHTLDLGAAGRPRRPRAETTRLGKEIYGRDLRAQVEVDHIGEVVAIDVDSGDYAIDDTGLAAAKRLLARDPDADIWCLRVGYGVLRHFGGRPLRRTE